MQFKLAVLTILAARTDGRATFDEIKNEFGMQVANFDRGDVSSDLDDIDIFQKEYVVRYGSVLGITQAGRAALAKIKSSADLAAPPSTHSPEPVDRAATESRPELTNAKLQRSDDLSENEKVDIAYSTITPPLLDAAPPVSRPHDDTDRTRVPVPRMSRREKLPNQFSIRFRRLQATWRRHLEREIGTLEAGPRQTSSANGGAMALLSVLIILICAGTVIALTRTRSLQAEIATLQRELALLKERTARADNELAKQQASQQRELAKKAVIEQTRTGPNHRTDQPPLDLTQEDIQIIKEYIKPAPPIGTPMPAIKVGDTVGTATIPLPSPLMEKIPKLLGARFTTRNGSIIILRRDSWQADVVLSPN